MNVSDKSMTLRAQEHGHQPVVCIEYCGDRSDPSVSTETSYCIPPDPVNDRQQAVCIPLTQREGWVQPCITGAFMGGQGAKARSIAWCEDGTTPTLKSAPSGGNTVPDIVYPINLMVATRGGQR